MCIRDSFTTLPAAFSGALYHFLQAKQSTRIGIDPPFALCSPPARIPREEDNGGGRQGQASGRADLSHQKGEGLHFLSVSFFPSPVLPGFTLAPVERNLRCDVSAPF